jgi:hypothetical protein
VWNVIFFYIYRVSINSFLDYKNLIQENYYTSRLCNCNITINTWHKILETNLSNVKKKYVFIPRSFLVISVCNQGKNLCSPCILFSDVHDTLKALPTAGPAVTVLCPLSYQKWWITVSHQGICRSKQWQISQQLWNIIIIRPFLIRTRLATYI